ncbi:tetratricopeptide repeat protein [Adhaeribacter radiodurans]|uniref:Transcriptional regulator n=1 Tax=Adhaeribacter radiodurans TaxID=2745197 RepID=A0A7L7L8D0_9BACT|nr:transcriptional regulator [Adhaeribacter radiodurans]QMU29048.1 transcriptional regulator [Adhaeribacter radiodurans]
MYQQLTTLSGRLFSLFLLLLLYSSSLAQTRFLTQVPSSQRLPLFWRYCSDQLISDWDSTNSHHFLQTVVHTADSLGDKRLKAYAEHFQRCYRIPFSENNKQYFPRGDYRPAVAQLARTKSWALQKGYPDIAASCDHYTGQIYFLEAQYGPAFEYLLQAQTAFQKIGYHQVPNASGYLSDLGLYYYRFEDYDKALAAYLTATKYSFYLPRTEINTYNTIGLIYAKQHRWPQARLFYRKTMARAAALNMLVWVGIGAGNLGQTFVAQKQNDSALFYLRRSYQITSQIVNRAPEDAAYTALALATVFVRKQQLDSAGYYLTVGQKLAQEYIREPTGFLEFRKRLLQVSVDLNKAAGKYSNALYFSDALNQVKDSLQQVLDAKILNRAVNKAETKRHQAEVNLLESEKSLSRLRYSVILGTFLSLLIIGGLLFNRIRMRQKKQVELAQKELQYAQEALNAYVQALKEKTALVDNLSAQLPTTPDKSDSDQLALKINNLVASTMLTEEAWQHFWRLFEQVYPGFMYRLKKKFPDLSPAETRLLILTKFNLSTREMAHTLGISGESIRKARYRLRKKLNLEEEASLDALIQNI